MIVTFKYFGITRGWDDQKRSDVTQMRISEFSDSFFSIILDIQQDQPDLIDPGIYVTNDYGLSRSERKGAMIISQYDKVTEYSINRTNHWNIVEEDVVHGPTSVVYSER